MRREERAMKIIGIVLELYRFAETKLLIQSTPHLVQTVEEPFKESSKRLLTPGVRLRVE